MRVTFQDAIDSRLPSVVGSCGTDERFRQLLNECLERLMYEGHWHTTVQKMRFCAVDGCITYPPQVATVERVAICGQPVTLRTQWHEWMEGGMGIRSSINSTSNTSSCCGSSGCGTNESLFRGYFPTFADINPTNQNKKVNLVCDLASDVGKKVIVFGYNSDGMWVRTLQDGVIADGEVILLAQSAGTTSTIFYSSITDIQFNESRDSKSWLYEYNTTTLTRRMIGQFEAFERRPHYGRWFFPGILSGAASNGNCQQALVEAMVKLNFWPVVSRNDFLCVPCLPALKELLMATNEAEHSPDGVKKQQIMAAGLGAALHILNSQLDHFAGSGNRINMSVTGSNFPDSCPVEQLV